MDVTLATVTIISLLLAWAMAIVSWQRVRAERRRGDARVAALLAEFAGRPAPRGEAAARERGRPVEGPAATAAGPARRGRPPGNPRLPFAAPAAPPPQQRRPAGSPRRAARTRWGHGLAAVAVGTVLVAGVSLADRTAIRPDGEAVPVELLSLDHRRQGDYLAVSGSLRNPPAGRERTRLSVTATALDRTGAIIGTGQTPLPVAALPPGGETAFTIALPDADLIGRYRVSFMEDQSKLPHVDRRGPDAAAAAETGP